MSPPGRPEDESLDAQRAGGRASSLRGRLLLLLFGLAAAVSAIVGAVTYRSVLREADALFDYHLRQMALSLRDQGAIAPDERAALEDASFDYVVQVWAGDGALTYASHALPGLPQSAVLGFADIDIGGRRWRVYSTAARGRVVQVAQPLSARQQLAASAAWRSVAPILVAAPLVAVALWWLVGLSLAPLRPLLAAVKRRDAESLAPLPLAGLPSEIVPVVQALNALLARLHTAFDAQRSFTADAAHELRSPLTALKLQLDLVRRAGDEAQRADALRELGAGIERLRHLVEQLLTLARAEPGGHAAPLAPIDLAEVARQASADSVALAAARGVELELEAPVAVTVQGDAGALRILVRNLIDNALRHAGGGRVQVSVAEDGDAAVLRVDDAGPGIPPAERARVFDRFYRRDGSETGGSGLGLAIVRTIADRHGARVVLADAPLGGLRVEVRLPRQADRAPAAA
jgi:two-component system OmpR family sensor kinase/two-component system sensor histidine kinase QseC